MSMAQRIGPRAGVLGSVVLLLASIVAALVYKGTAGEGFSPLNHWISELGEMPLAGIERITGMHGNPPEAACHALARLRMQS